MASERFLPPCGWRFRARYLVMDPLEEAVRLAADNVRGGGEPFGAVVVTADGRRFRGVNAPEAMRDPTAHAEINAIRGAAAKVGADLRGATLYSSGQPCPMCLAAAIWANLDALFYAATQQDAADAGLDNGPLYEQVAGGVDTVVDLKVARGAVEDATKPFREWKRP